MFLTPLEVTSGIGSLAFVGAMLSLAQKARNDRKDAWWKRAQWAMDQAFSPDAGRRETGFLALTILGKNERATGEDKKLLAAATAQALEARRQALEARQQPQGE